MNIEKVGFPINAISEDTYSVQTTKELLEIKKSDMTSLIETLQVDYPIEDKGNQYYIGDYANHPTYRKYLYTTQVIYSNSEPKQLLDSEGQPVSNETTIRKQYVLKNINEESTFIDDYKVGLFPIPMLSGDINIFYEANGNISDSPVFTIVHNIDGTVTTTMDYDKLQENLIFIEKSNEFGEYSSMNGNIIFYEVGDIYYNVTDKTFYQLTSTTSDIIYYDDTQIMDPQYNEDGTLIPNGSSVLDDSGNVLYIINYTIGGDASVAIETRRWNPCDRPTGCIINKYNGSVWTPDRIAQIDQVGTIVTVGNMPQEVFNADTKANQSQVNIMDSQINDITSNKADKSTTYTKTENDDLLDVKADKVMTYTKNESDSLLDYKADKVNTYTKVENNNLFDLKANQATTYTKIENDTILSDKIAIYDSNNDGIIDRVGDKNSKSWCPLQTYYNGEIVGAGMGIVIKLPYRTDSGKMVSFGLRITDDYMTRDIIIAGYLYGATNMWYSPTADMRSGDTALNITFFRENDNMACIWFPADRYLGITVYDVFSTHSGANWQDGWDIVVGSTPPTGTAQITVSCIQPITKVNGVKPGNRSNEISITTSSTGLDKPGAAYGGDLNYLNAPYFGGYSGYASNRPNGGDGFIWAGAFDDRLNGEYQVQVAFVTGYDNTVYTRQNYTTNRNTWCSWRRFQTLNDREELYPLKRTEIDLRGTEYDRNTYYTVAYKANNQSITRNTIKIYTNLNDSRKTAQDTWMLHEAGYSMMFEYQETGSGWGAQNPERCIYASAFSFTDIHPIGEVGQLTNSSCLYVRLRGGGFYRFYCTPELQTPTLQTTDYTAHGQTLSAATTTPVRNTTNVSLMNDIRRIDETAIFKSGGWSAPGVPGDRLFGITNGADAESVFKVDGGQLHFALDGHFYGQEGTRRVAYATGGDETFSNNIRFGMYGGVGHGTIPAEYRKAITVLPNNGVWIGNNLAEGGGFMATGQLCCMWSPCDEGAINYFDSDNANLIVFSIDAAGTYTSRSDARLKENITNYTHADILTLLDKVRLVEFTYKQPIEEAEHDCKNCKNVIDEKWESLTEEEKDSQTFDEFYNKTYKQLHDKLCRLKKKADKVQQGVIAQEILPLFPEVVSVDDYGMYRVAYTQLVLVAIEAIQAQNKKMASLEERLAILEQKLLGEV